jgi:hypothetical protein
VSSYRFFVSATPGHSRPMNPYWELFAGEPKKWIDVADGTPRSQAGAGWRSGSTRAVASLTRPGIVSSTRRKRPYRTRQTLPRERYFVTGYPSLDRASVMAYATE